jgi:hypothetical protein
LDTTCKSSNASRAGPNGQIVQAREMKQKKPWKEGKGHMKSNEDTAGHHSGGKGIQKIRQGYKKGLDTLFSRGQSTFHSEKHKEADARHYADVNPQIYVFFSRIKLI